MSSSKPRLRVKGWLDEDSFQELVEFMDYLGRDGPYKLFEFNYDRARKAGYEPLDVLNVLSGLKDLAVPEDLDRMEDFILENYSATLRYENDRLLLSSKTFLKDYLKDIQAPIKYNHELRAFELPPYLYLDIIKHLRSRGLPVIDNVKLLDNAKLPRIINFSGQLRPYQQEAVEAWINNHGRGVIVLPTGAGKTVVAISAMARVNLTTLVVVYTKEHIKQWSDSIARFTDAAGLIGHYYGDEKTLGPITITTYQTAFRYIRDLSRRFALVIFDEAHHLPADKFKAIAIKMMAPYRMGLSATAVREDGKHEEIFPLIGGIVYQKTAAELMQQGYLAPFMIKRITVKLTPEEQKRYDELRKQYFSLVGGRQFQEVLEAAKKGDQRAIEALKVRAQMQDIIQQSENKINKVIEIAKEELSRGSKIIVFTQYKKQAEEIAERLGAHLIHGDIDKERRLRELEAFKHEQSGVLVVTTVGDEGLDIPDANVGMLVSGTGSRRQFIQRLGRLLRPMPNKVAVLYEVVASGTSEVAQSRKRREALEGP